VNHAVRSLARSMVMVSGFTFEAPRRQVARPLVEAVVADVPEVRYERIGGIAVTVTTLPAGYQPLGVSTLPFVSALPTVR